MIGINQLINSINECTGAALVIRSRPALRYPVSDTLLFAILLTISVEK